jgi:hypothetical protein
MADLSGAFETSDWVIGSGSFCTTFFAHETVKNITDKIHTKEKNNHTFLLILFAPYFRCWQIVN